MGETHLGRRLPRKERVPLVGIVDPAALTHDGDQVQVRGREPAWRPGVVPIRASPEYALALEKHHKVVQYQVYPNESYYVYGRANQRQLLLDMLEWFDRYLTDGAAAPSW